MNYTALKEKDIIPMQLYCGMRKKASKAVATTQLVEIRAGKRGNGDRRQDI